MRALKYYVENKAQYYIVRHIGCETIKNNKKLFSHMSNLQTYYHFKLDFQKVESVDHRKNIKAPRLWPLWWEFIGDRSPIQIWPSCCFFVPSAALRSERKSSKRVRFESDYGDRWIPCKRASNAENISIWWRHHLIDFFYEYPIIRFQVQEVI